MLLEWPPVHKWNALHMLASYSTRFQDFTVDEFRGVASLIVDAGLPADCIKHEHAKALVQDLMRMHKALAGMDAPAELVDTLFMVPRAN